MNRERSALGCLVVAVFSISCGKVEEIQPATETVVPTSVRDANPAPDSVAFDVLPDVPKPEKCPEAQPGPQLVFLPRPHDTAFCIDRTEVTQGQYLEFLESKGYPGPVDTSGQPDECRWNTSLVPERIPGETDTCWREEDGYFLSQNLERAVGCVDFCDSLAYCRWAGKRLCGRMGGGAVSKASWGDPEESEWTWACTQGGTSARPYGDAYEPARCVDKAFKDANGLVSTEVASSPGTCTGQSSPFDTIVNLVGNVYEWENGCGTGEQAVRGCPIRGGSLDDYDANRLSCKADIVQAQEAYSGATTIGFRCCADAE